MQGEDETVCLLPTVGNSYTKGDCQVNLNTARPPNEQMFCSKSIVTWRENAETIGSYCTIFRIIDGTTMKPKP